MNPDFRKVYALARRYRASMSGFLRDMVAIPSESRNEGPLIRRIREEMEIVGFDAVEIDPMGNLLGYIGTGKHLIAMDAHVDTVGPGNLENRHHDPYRGFEDKDCIWGLGTSDRTGGMAAIYAVIPWLYVQQSKGGKSSR